jgi:aminomethyltransferase
MARTALYERHRDLGARFVDFAGWEMPIQYASGINQEHVAVRQDAGLFDVSHMGELRVRGADALRFMRFATLNDVERLRIGRGHYSMLPNDRGGLVDDLYVYRDGEDDFLVVANAGSVAAVLAHLRDIAGADAVEIEDESAQWGLLALQGPGAAVRLERVAGVELTTLRKNATRDVHVDGLPVRVARTGYTGEDGFELFTAWDDSVAVWDRLVAEGAVPCGLGSRDTLRLEAGFPLYGHELTGDTNPLCTPFAWVVKDKPFYGRDAMWGRPCRRRLVGLRVTGRGIPRQGYEVLDDAGRRIGVVTSGTLSPLTREAIGMAWVGDEHSGDGTAVSVVVRGQTVPATVTTPPFYTP